MEPKTDLNLPFGCPEDSSALGKSLTSLYYFSLNDLLKGENCFTHLLQLLYRDAVGFVFFIVRSPQFGGCRTL